MKSVYLKSNFKLFLCTLVLLLGSCKKFIEVGAPVTSVNAGNVYNNDNTAIAVLTSMFEKMSTNPSATSTITSMSLFPELSADNLSLFDPPSLAYSAYYANNLKATGGDANNRMFWQVSYSQIYVANAAIEGLTGSSNLTPSIKQRLLGEAKFLRAFYFFYLVNLYGDVPLTLWTDYVVNSSLGRTPKSEVYVQIIKDLKEAQTLLNDDYVDITFLSPSVERIRPNKSSATALLARVYLYTGDYPNAEIESSKVLDNAQYSLLNLDQVFLKNSNETIWSLQPVDQNINTWEGALFIFPNGVRNPAVNYLHLNNRLISRFEPGDQRLQIWVGNSVENGQQYYYAYKYKVGAGATGLEEYTVVLRLAEQYLIRAEVRAQQGNITGTNSALSDLNALRERAGLLPIIEAGQEEILDIILREKQVELFTEWGHRWLDLKRTGKIDEVMYEAALEKGGQWEPYKALYPISQEEINLNPGMKDQQNPGY